MIMMILTIITMLSPTAAAGAQLLLGGAARRHGWHARFAKCRQFVTISIVIVSFITITITVIIIIITSTITSIILLLLLLSTLPDRRRSCSIGGRPSGARSAAPFMGAIVPRRLLSCYVVNL